MKPAKLIFSKNHFSWMAISAALLMLSCNDQAGGGVTIPVPNDTSALAKINHFIPQDTLALFQRAFAAERDSLARLRPGLFIPVSEAFNKPAVIKALQDPNCVGIRIYYGLKTGADGNEIRLILTGVDSQGRDLFITEGGPAAQAAAQVGIRSGASEYGQCVPPCK